MGEARKLLFGPLFNRSIKVRGMDDRLTSDAGVMLLREADHRLGLTESLGERLYDPRQAEKIRYPLAELLRERMYSLALGYQAQDDLDRLAHDPAMRMAVWEGAFPFCGADFAAFLRLKERWRVRLQFSHSSVAVAMSNRCGRLTVLGPASPGPVGPSDC